MSRYQERVVTPHNGLLSLSMSCRADVCKVSENRTGDLHPNLWSPQRRELAHQLFIYEGTHILEGGMPPCPIVKGFDVIKGAAPGLRSCLK